MSVPTDLLNEFCRVTNADEALASQLLGDSGLDLQAAIHSFFAIQDAGGLPHDEAPQPPATDSPPEERELEQVIANLPEPHNAPPPPSNVPPPSHPQMAPPPRVAPRTSLEDIAGIHPAADPFQDADDDSNRRSAALAELFRRPTQLIFPDPLEAAMAAGRSRSRWLLVNVQRSDVFASHVMNRDVWSDDAVRTIIQVHFVFWQRDEHRATEYTRFYSYNAAPHVAIIDPRSGERARVWGDNEEPIPKVTLLDALQDFVSGNSLESDAVIRGRAGRSGSGSAPAVGSGAATVDLTDAGDGIEIMDVEGTEANDEVPRPSSDTAEDAQLAAAIAASMEDSPTENGGSSSAAAGGGAGADTASLQREVSRMQSATDPTLIRSRSIRAEQDDAFLESLALDRAKEASEQSEKLRKEEARKEELARERERAELREVKRRRVPEAPSLDSKVKVTELAIRLPDGRRLQRRFFANDNIGNVYDYIETEVEALNGVGFELMSAYPKKRFVDREALLEELAPKAALVVHLEN